MFYIIYYTILYYTILCNVYILYYTIHYTIYYIIQLGCAQTAALVGCFTLRGWILGKVRTRNMNNRISSPNFPYISVLFRRNSRKVEVSFSKDFIKKISFLEARGHLGRPWGAFRHRGSIFDDFSEAFWRHLESIGRPLASKGDPLWAFFDPLATISQHRGGIGCTTRCAPCFYPPQGKKKWGFWEVPMWLIYSK